jgi:hypothetical protein
MAQTPDNLNPLLQRNFRLFIEKLPQTTLFVNEVELPTLSAESQVMDFPDDYPRKFVGFGSGVYGEFTINFIVDEDLNNYTEIKKWMDAMYGSITDIRNYSDKLNPQGLMVPHSIFPSDGKLFLFTNGFQTNIEINLYGLVPTSLSSLSFSTTELKDTSPLNATLTFDLQKYDITKL